MKGRNSGALWTIAGWLTIAVSLAGIVLILSVAMGAGAGHSTVHHMTKTEAQGAWQQADVIAIDSNGTYIGDIPLLVWGDIGKDTSVNCQIERGSTVMVTRFYDDTHPPSAHIRKGSCSGYVSQMQLKWEE